MELLLAMVAALASLGLLVPWVWVIADIARRPAWQWQRAGHQQITWLLVVLFAGVFGIIIYLVYIRRRLNAAKAEGVSLMEPPAGHRPLPGGPPPPFFTEPAPIELLDPDPYLGSSDNPYTN